MRSTILPIHPVNGLSALGFRRNGQSIWPIMGGAPDPEDPQDNPDDPGDDPDDPADEPKDNPEDDDDEKLGEAGLKALRANKEKYKAERTRRQQVEAELATLKAARAGGDDPEAQQREAAAAERERETIAKANRRIVNAEVRAAAAGKLSDPADALRFLDIDQFEVDDDGDLDQDEIADAIKDLLTQKPYLAAQGGKRTPKPDGRQGGGQKSTGGTVAAGREAYAARHKKPTV